MIDAEIARRVATLAATDIGRGSSLLAEPVIDDLGGAAASLLEVERPNVGIVTGFLIRNAHPPAAETDGPLGAVLLAAALTRLGATAEIVTDPPCAPVLRGTVDGSGLGAVTVSEWPSSGADGWTHIVSIERVGRTSDGTYRTRRGEDVSGFTAPLDDLFESSSVPRIAIGDGGNEIGMGRLPDGLISAVVEKGELIRCVIGCDHLVVAGTSNWGAYALTALLSASTGHGADLLTENVSRSILDASVAAGAIDSATGLRRPAVDGLDWADYWSVPARIRQLLST